MLVFICRWYGIHTKSPEIIIHYIQSVFSVGVESASMYLELYHPEKVFIQCDRVQIILPSLLSLEKVRRGSTANKYHISYTWSDNY